MSFLDTISKKIEKYMEVSLAKKQYVGKNFRWKIVPDCPTPFGAEAIKVGDPVRCMNVYYSENYGCVVLDMSAGTPVPITQVGQYLEETSNDMSGFAMDNDLNNKSVEKKKKDFANLSPEDILGKKSTTVVEDVEEVKVEPIAVAPKEPKVDIFSGFKKTKRDFSMSVDIELPSESFLSMMYDNADNKEKFLADLAEYIIDNMKVDCVVSALKKQFNTQDVSDIENSELNNEKEVENE